MLGWESGAGVPLRYRSGRRAARKPKRSGPELHGGGTGHRRWGDRKLPAQGGKGGRSPGQACCAATDWSALARTGARSSCCARTNTFIASMAATEATIALSSFERWERGLLNIAVVLRWCCALFSKGRAKSRLAQKTAAFSTIRRTTCREYCVMLGNFAMYWEWSGTFSS